MLPQALERDIFSVLFSLSTKLDERERIQINVWRDFQRALFSTRSFFFLFSHSEHSTHTYMCIDCRPMPEDSICIWSLISLLLPLTSVWAFFSKEGGGLSLDTMSIPIRIRLLFFLDISGGDHQIKRWVSFHFFWGGGGVLFNFLSHTGRERRI